jgi:hypothetical protein
MSCTDILQGVADPSCYPQGGTIPIGGPCNNDWQCASGVCWQATSPDTCGMCAMVTTVDQPCQVDATLGPLCPDNLICTETDPTGAHLACKPIVPIGSPCVQTEICPGNAYCDSTTSLCKQLPAIGQPCDYPIWSCDPTQTGSACDGTTCKAVVAVANGQPCGTVNGNDVRCNGSCGPIDDAGTGICHAFLPRGAACGTDDLCSFDTTCTGGVCSAAVCGGATSSGKDAAVAAFVKPASGSGRQRAARPPWILPGLGSRPAR